MLGSRSHKRRKSSASRTKRSVERTAVTVAERGSRDSSAISPKNAPSSRRTFPLPASTSTAPPAMRYMASPRSPLRTITVPECTVRALRMLKSSAIELASSSANNGTRATKANVTTKSRRRISSVKAPPDNGDRKREATDPEHDSDRRYDAAKCRNGCHLATTDLRQHACGPPQRFGHVAKPLGLDRALDRMHRGSRCQQYAREDDDAGQQGASLGGDDLSQCGKCRRVARKLEKSHKPRQLQEYVLGKQELQGKRHESQRVNNHERRPGETKASRNWRMSGQERMLGRRPKTCSILQRKHQHAQSIEKLQRCTMAQRDVRHSLRYRCGDVSKHERDHDPIDGARGWLPAAPMLEDLKGALAQELGFLAFFVQRSDLSKIVGSTTSS